MQQSVNLNPTDAATSISSAIPTSSDHHQYQQGRKLDWQQKQLEYKLADNNVINTNETINIGDTGHSFVLPPLLFDSDELLEPTGSATLSATEACYYQQPLSATVNNITNIGDKCCEEQEHHTLFSGRSSRSTSSDVSLMFSLYFF
uniref:NAC domain-containing protein n=1 Tax=Setaria digitata TaxID=48799 RepID=A0A915Q3I2_9BILA